MEPVTFRSVSCPYCGEPIELQVDESAGEQAAIEDCTVCCRPIEVRLVATAVGLDLEVKRDDE